MKKTRILLAIGLILAVATPALAEIKFSGFYRLMGYSNELKDTDYDRGDSQAWVDQRLRAQVTNTLNDNVSITYQAEIDTVWGEAGKGGTDGKFDTDSVNVETKHVYLDLKSGDTSARLGLQNHADDFQGVIVNGDMAGATVKHKIGNTSLGLLYAKWDENNGTQGTTVANSGRSNWDDTDFFGVSVNQKFNDNFKAGAAVYYLDANDVTDLRPNVMAGLEGIDIAAPNDQADAEIFFYGVNADAKFGDFGVDGFVVYQRGEVDNDTVSNNQETEAWLVSAKARMKLANGDIGLRGIYVSDDDSDDDDEYWIGSFGEYDFVNENQMIFLTDKFTCNATKERYAMDDAASSGYGLMAFILSGNHNLPENMYVNWGLGYYAAMDDERNDEFVDSREGKTLGYEGTVRVGKKVFEKVDISLNAAYAGFGNFYDDKFENNNDGTNNEGPDDIYKTYLMVNVPF